MAERIGLVGFGIMGTSMAPVLLEAGYRLTVFDADAAALERAGQMGCETAGSAAAVAAAGELHLISLPRPEHVTSAVQGPDGLLRTATAGSVIVDTSTVDPETTRKNAATAAAQGIGYLDAPVLGRPRGTGSWTLPVGGDEADLRRAAPVLRTVASKIIHVGPAGQGNAVKLLNNLMFGAINAATCEMFAVSDQVGLDRRLLYDTIVDSGAATVSNLFRELGPKIIEGDYEPLFSVDNLEKDIGLGLAMARSSGLTLEVGEAGQRLNQQAQQAGHGAEDTSSIVQVAGGRPADEASA